MKYLLLTYYGLRSLLLRGLPATLRILREERGQEHKLGIDTASFKASRTAAYYHYQGAPYRVLIALLQKAREITGDLPFYDIGSGMGRALFVAAMCGYTRLRGIELDAELHDAALRNSAKFKAPGHGADIQLSNENALDYKYPETPAVFFFFNPFNEAVMNQVVERILSSQKQSCYLIYMNPMHRKPFEDRNLSKVYTFKTWLYTEAVIYKWNYRTS